MVRFRFKKGLAFIQKDTTWTLQRRKPSGKLEFLSDADQTVSLTDSQVYRNLETHDWVTFLYPQHLQMADWANAKSAAAALALPSAQQPVDRCRLGNSLAGYWDGEHVAKSSPRQGAATQPLRRTKPIEDHQAGSG